ncbi:Uncharacterised protein [Serratia fonticola]|uniref:Uncharacterized protein n=1 Tax=Serratia fonticola TaxID=47917 RepID=A0A4U9TKA5_SERFO|nr:Uncharacterised protein [Serratia fonticola]
MLGINVMKNVTGGHPVIFDVTTPCKPAIRLVLLQAAAARRLPSWLVPVWR